MCSVVQNRQWQGTQQQRLRAPSVCSVDVNNWRGRQQQGEAGAHALVGIAGKHEKGLIRACCCYHCLRISSVVHDDQTHALGPRSGRCCSVPRPIFGETEHTLELRIVASSGRLLLPFFARKKKLKRGARDVTSPSRPSYTLRSLACPCCCVYLATCLRRQDKRSGLVAAAAVGLVSVATAGER